MAIPTTPVCTVCPYQTFSRLGYFFIDFCNSQHSVPDPNYSCPTKSQNVGINNNQEGDNKSCRPLDCYLQKYKKDCSTAFEEQHRAELTAYRAAAAYFKANNITKLPSPKKLEAEYAQLASEKAKFYEQYKEAKEELLKLKTAKQNVASFFREEEQTQQER